jgi:hypothetical protein
MTPAEHARQIDKEEFAAECAAVRERALVYAETCRKAEADKLDAWMNDGKKRKAPRKRGILPRHNRNAVEAASRVNMARAKRYEAFGYTRSLREWSEETGLPEGTLRSRLKYGWTLEDALSRDVQVHNRGDRPGVVSDFAPSKGTGAGSSLYPPSNLEFSKETAE